MSELPLSSAEREELIREILELFRERYVALSGFPCETVPTGTADLLPELGDYAPLIAAAGDRDFALAQGELASRILQASPLLPGLRTRFRPGGRFAGLLRRMGAVHVQDYAEILLGFVELHQTTRDARALTWATWLARWLLTVFGSSRGIASFWLRGRLPLLEPLSGNIVEGMLDAAELANDAALQEGALALLAPWVENPAFGRFGLWPSWVVGSPRVPAAPISLCRRIDVAKANTSMCSALLRAYAATKDEGWADAVRAFANEGLPRLAAAEGGLHTLAFLGGSGRTIEPVGRVNSSNHAVIEVLLDAHRLLGDRALLDRALALATFWRELVHRDTGLMPDVVGGTESFVDSNTDFAVLFRKIHDLTRDRAWLRASERLVTAVARFHRTEYGLANRTYVATGKVADPMVETRYTSLFLKALILPQGKSVWEIPTLLSLLRDR